MPYVEDDDSKAVKRIAEIEQQLQDKKTEFDRWLSAASTLASAAEVIRREHGSKALTDQIQALATALELQRALASPELHQQERQLAKASPKKMKDFGYRPVTVQFLGGQEVELMARYWCRSRAASEKGKGGAARRGRCRWPAGDGPTNRPAPGGVPRCSACNTAGGPRGGLHSVGAPLRGLRRGCRVRAAGTGAAGYRIRRKPLPFWLWTAARAGKGSGR